MRSRASLVAPSPSAARAAAARRARGQRAVDEEARGLSSGPERIQATRARALGPRSARRRSAPSQACRSTSGGSGGCEATTLTGKSSSSGSGRGGSAWSGSQAAPVRFGEDSSISTNASRVSASEVPSRLKNSALWEPPAWSISTRAGLEGTNEAARHRMRVAAESQRPASRSAAIDQRGPAMRLMATPPVRTWWRRSGASAERTGRSSHLGSMTRAAPACSGAARASAAMAGMMAERVFPLPDSPSASVWRVRTARGTSPSGGKSADHSGMRSPGGADGDCACGSGSASPTRSMRCRVCASGLETGHSQSKTAR